MLAYVKGKLASSTPIYAIVEAGGIGYKIFIPARLFALLPPLGAELQLHTSFIVRELSQSLYGFQTEQERDLFEALLNVTGIGPKLALSLIGHMSVFDLHQAISGGDIPAIVKVPGIGKKTAERLIMELRDKLPGLNPADFAIQVPVDAQAQKINDAMSALINLGYNQSTAQKAIKKTLKDTDEAIPFAEFITLALKNI